jgi:hypothetical protein
VQQPVGRARPIAGLELRQQVEPSVVVGAVAAPAECHHAIGMVAAAERARHQLRPVDRSPTAGQARLVGLSQTSRALNYPPTA